MRVRFGFAGGFLAILFLAAYAGLLPHSPEPSSAYQLNDKVLHLLTFFCLTLVFYFILDASRRRVLNLTLVVCTFVLGVGSELAQGFLPNGRTFDPFDIVANLVGSLAACGLASWYHKRMLERRRKNKYAGVGDGEEGEEDLELGEGPGPSVVDEDDQETGVVSTAGRGKSLEEEVDNWDENAADEPWDEDQDIGTAATSESAGKMTPASSNADDEHDKKVAKD